ncbi:MAG: RsmB/NOP family class I SAM-dependent RNA methyltransferase [Firmicutes bacterium]|nr:RsmB/NOP family class I SAM-dependent RNA methyltransferase [Bacillota bacterium]
MELPFKYTEKMKTLLGGEFDEYMASFDDSRFYGLRINTLKLSAEEFEKKNIFSLKKVHWCDTGFYYEENARPAKHPYYHAGLYYLQEPSAMSSAEVLPIEEGDRVLDLCAAPGGKTTQLAAKMQGSGVLVSNDISAGRTKALVKNVELMGIKNAIVTSETPEKLASKFEGYFTKILVDAPCSGEGMFRKEPDIIKSWNDEMLDFCVSEQEKILESAAKMLAPDGMLLYSTCTFNPDEDERMIEKFLESHQEFSLCNIDEKYGFDKGRKEWTETGNAEIEKCARLWPHKIDGEGHFVALLKKNSTASNLLNIEKTNCKDKRLNIFFEFADKNLNINFDKNANYQFINDGLYMLPEDIPSLKGIRVMRSGMYLGEFKKDRFEPSQHLAMCLKKEEIKVCADMALEDERVIRYLKGETVDFENINDGWCVVCADTFPLGWAKAQKGRLKNKYATGWRWE